MDTNCVLLEILRSQIAEIHASLETNFLRQVKSKNRARFRRDETRKVNVVLEVTCIDSGEQRLVVEELSRLLSLSVSIGTSLENIRRLDREEEATV